MIRIAQGPVQDHMYRLGLAGAGQADLIEAVLKAELGKVLDLGCGPQGHHVANLARIAGFLAAVDHDPRMVEAARSDGPIVRAAFLVADAYQLPFKTESFRHVVALGLLAYIRKFETLFHELARVTSLDGTVTVSNSASRPPEPVVEAAHLSGLHLLTQNESFCPAASGEKKARFLWIFRRVAAA